MTNVGGRAERPTQDDLIRSLSLSQPRQTRIKRGGITPVEEGFAKNYRLSLIRESEHSDGRSHPQITRKITGKS